MNLERIKLSDEFNNGPIWGWDGADLSTKARRELCILKNLFGRGIGIDGLKPHVAVKVEVEQAEFGQKPFWAAAAMAKILPRLAIPRAVAEIGDEVATFYEAIPPPIPGVLLRSMSSRPKGDMGRITR
jgi:hypothetical protein